jgi:hypothetical protein
MSALFGDYIDSLIERNCPLEPTVSGNHRPLTHQVPVTTTGHQLPTRRGQLGRSPAEHTLRPSASC